MSKRRVTSTDVAKATGVSRSSVSLVLNGRGDGMVDAEKQARIRAVARELGYVPNASAVNLRRQRTATIGLVTDAIASAPFAGPLLSAASDLALEAGYMILTIDTWQHPDYVDGAMTTLRARDVDGLIYAEAGLRQLDALDAPPGLPLVLANAFVADDSLPAFVPDDEAGGRAAAELAIDAGHRRIAFITGGPESPATERRVRGFTAAMNAAGLPVDGTVVQARYSVGTNHAAALELLRRPDRPTTILAAKHELRVGAPLTGDDLTTVRVRFTNGNDSGRYLSADADVKGLVVGRTVGEGEFLPKDAAVPKSEQTRTEMPLSVATGRLPSDTAVGDIVDVWVVPKEEGQSAKPLWSSVRVLQIDSVKGVSGSTARRQVLISLASSDLPRIPAALTAISAGEPTLVRKGN